MECREELKKLNRISKCCQNGSAASLNAGNEDGGLCETLNDLVSQSPSGMLTSLINNNNNNNGPDKCAHRFARKDPIDLKFAEVYYRTFMFKLSNGISIERKEILHKVSGEFKSGQLSAIMGPSGAGKSTLLNILAGYITRGSSGTVMMNNQIRDNNPKFQKLVAYIPQDEELRLSLTAIENMTVAAHLKLGYTVTNEYKTKQVSCTDYATAWLRRMPQYDDFEVIRRSKKRLAIALELLSNPPILFLDEPTTGLDSLSCTQCVSLLKRLAEEGRTVVCTIHQPSALIFEKFDKLYALSDGVCIYDGTIGNLLPHLSSFGLTCPPYHNPADFLMEVAIGEHAVNVDELSKHSEVMRRKEKGSTDSVRVKELESQGISSIRSRTISPDPLLPPANMLMQFLLLYKRNLIMAKREYSIYLNRFLAHIFIGFLFGYLYSSCGYGAQTVLANYVYLYGTLLLIVYTGQMSVTLSFPLEMKILSREHFNRWYSLSPYIFAGVLIEIPFQIICTWSYIAITYWLTEQPTDYRIYFFVVFCTLSTLCAQAWGYFIGATTPIKIAVFLGPVLACLFSIFGFCIRYLDTPVMFRWMYTISYFRAGFQGLVYSVYGLPRSKLHCPESAVYCHYQVPSDFLGEMDMENVNLWSNISLIIIISFLMHAFTYAAVWLKLHKR